MKISDVTSIDRRRLADVATREAALFSERTSRSRDWLIRSRQSMPNGVPMAWMQGLYRHIPPVASRGQGSWFEDLDGNRYIDFNLCDLSLTVGYNNALIGEALRKQLALGTQFLLPTTPAVAASEGLTKVFGLPFWQFTLSASGANAEAIRLARLATGRERILLLEGKYHGHIDETLVKADDHGTVPELKGLPRHIGRNSTVVPFNDINAVRTALSNGDVALLLAEPALTNCTLVLPEDGYLKDLREATTQAGTLLCFDETHTVQFDYGGFTRASGVTPDLLTVGKGLGTGIAFGAYGMTKELARLCEANLDVDVHEDRGLAIGGTVYANPLSLTAAATGLEQLLTRENYARVSILGARLADGIDAICKRHRLPWRAFRYGPRSGFCGALEFPRNLEEAIDASDLDIIDARKLYMANRGLWDAMASAGPQVGFAHSIQDVDRYVEVAADFIEEIIA